MANLENDELEDEYLAEYMPLVWYLTSKKVKGLIGPSWEVHLMEIDENDDMTEVYLGIPQMIPEEYKNGNWFVLFGDRQMDAEILHIGITKKEIIDKWLEEEPELAARKGQEEDGQPQTRIIDKTLTEEERTLRGLYEALCPTITVLDTEGKMLATGNVSDPKLYEPYLDYRIVDMQGISGGVIVVVSPPEKKEDKEK